MPEPKPISVSFYLDPDQKARIVVRILCLNTKQDSTQPPKHYLPTMDFLPWFRKNRAVEFAENPKTFNIQEALTEYNDTLERPLGVAEIDILQDIVVMWRRNLLDGREKKEGDGYATFGHPLIRYALERRKQDRELKEKQEE